MTKLFSHDNSSITELYNRHINMVYKICFLLLKNPMDAEDATQSIFTKVIEKNIRFDSIEHEKAWLIVASQNHCKNILRHWWKKVIPFDSNIHSGYKLDEYNSELLELVLALPNKFKLPIYLYYYEGYSTDDIAKILSLNPSTLRSRLKKGREILKLEIGGTKHEQ